MEDKSLNPDQPLIPNKDDVVIEKEETKQFSFSSVSRRNKVLLVCMALVNFCACTCFSLLGPFFPAEAEKKGSNTTITGMIFGCFEFVIFLSSPIFGNFITRIGSKFMFLSGTMTCGVCAILFGVLDKSPDGAIYIGMCFASRTVEALGASAFITASFAIIANTFPDYVTTVLGLLETFSGLGMLAGPAIGGALYQAGGYGLPFFVMGGIVIVCGLVCIFLMPPINDAHKPFSKSILYMLRNPYTWFIAFCSMSGSFTLGFIDPTLSQHLSKLSQLNGKTWAIGLMFLIASGIYTFTAPLWGYISDTKRAVKTMIVCGNIIGAVSILILGPSPLVSFIPFALWTQIVALILMGLGIGCSLIPTFTGLLDSAKQLGLPENFDTHGIISGFFNSCFSLGAFLGPIVGGVLVDSFEFEWASTLCAGLLLFSTLLLLVYGSVVHCCSSPSGHSGYEAIPGDTQPDKPGSHCNEIDKEQAC